MSWFVILRHMGPTIIGGALLFLSVKLVQVTDKSTLKKFIRFPHQLYRNHPYWVPPLYTSEFQVLNPKTNPSRQRAKHRMWLVLSQDKIIGRLCGIYLDHDPLGNNMLRFNWYDVEDNIDVSHILFDALSIWARELGASTVVGPYGFSNFDKTGMLSLGYHELPTISTSYHFPLPSQSSGLIGIFSFLPLGGI